MSTADTLTTTPTAFELACPHCGVMHIDQGEWAGRPHRTHRCSFCKLEWQPFSYPTRGILENGNGTSFAVPFIPPSVNHYKKPTNKHTWYLTEEAKAFIEAVAVFSRREPVAGPYFHVDIFFHLPTDLFLRIDADNLEKVSFDALTVAGVIPDDRYITRHTNQKLRCEDPEQVRTVYIVRGKRQP